MSDFFFEYGLFLAKAITVLITILLIVVGVGVLGGRNKRDASEGEVELTSLNDQFDDMKDAIEAAVLDREAYKQLAKEQKKKDKEESKKRKKTLKQGSMPESAERKRVYVLDFDGDIKASEVDPLREEISAVLTFARPEDEVVIRLESGGGLVHTYGLAASQLERIKARNIPLTVCVDEVAASGGYMMACLADKLLAAPFAIVGSIGVVAQLPNFHRLLQKHDVDYEMFTAGEYKRTVTMFGENTEKGKEKFIEELEDTHALFKEFVSQYRPQLDIEKVATGEVWFGKRALAEQLVDELTTSDDYLMKACEESDVYRVRYEVKKTLQERISDMTIKTADGLFTKALSRLANSRFISR
ncbi:MULTISPECIES: protease SohB [Neptunomonas]|uniref:Protease SohB n=1 Tax=Neptunomonas marina TaxID=1815562 RepID=A0A437QD73_9GAMM|nr:MULTISPECIES: protease SohB [Neptunomonas]RVU32492.1 protease SohB [Neptunomonas marina]